MSTTVELVRANERYARLRAAVEALAAEWEARAQKQGISYGPGYAAELRALFAAVDS